MTFFCFSYLRHLVSSSFIKFQRFATLKTLRGLDIGRIKKSKNHKKTDSSFDRRIDAEMSCRKIKTEKNGVRETGQANRRFCSLSLRPWASPLRLQSVLRQSLPLGQALAIAAFQAFRRLDGPGSFCSPPGANVIKLSCP